MRQFESATSEWMKATTEKLREENGDRFAEVEYNEDWGDKLETPTNTPTLGTPNPSVPQFPQEWGDQLRDEGDKKLVEEGVGDSFTHMEKWEGDSGVGGDTPQGSVQVYRTGGGPLKFMNSFANQ